MAEGPEVIQVNGPTHSTRLTIGILDRYMLSEFVGPFLFGVVAFTSIFLASDVLFEITRLVMKGSVGAGTAVKLFALSLPRILVLTFPMSTLLAALLSLSRLSQGSEIIAMRASGVSFLRITAPLMAAALVISAFTVGMNEYVVPFANSMYRRVMTVEVLKQKPLMGQNIVLREFKDGQVSQLLFAREYDGTTQVMSDVVIQDFEGGKLRRTTEARRGEWDDDGWYFYDGRIVDFGSGKDGAMVRLTFQRQLIPVNKRPEEVLEEQRDPEEMTMGELRRHIEALRAQGQPVQELEVQYHLKLAIPAASFFFILVAAPLGIQSHRSAKSMGFGVSIIIIFAYYCVMTLATALGQSGAISPVLGAWLADILLGIVGAFLVMRANR